MILGYTLYSAVMLLNTREYWKVPKGTKSSEILYSWDTFWIVERGDGWRGPSQGCKVNDIPIQNQSRAISVDVQVLCMLLHCSAKTGHYGSAFHGMSTFVFHAVIQQRPVVFPVDSATLW